MHPERLYYERLAAAYVRGSLGEVARTEDERRLFTCPLDALEGGELRRLVQIGEEHGLRLHRFKRTMDLARVRKVLGIFRGIAPESLLDIGSGRGAFLWPLLDAFPDLPVTTVDILQHRVRDMQAVRDGGVTHLSAVQADVTRLPFADGAFDVVTVLEVLEHVPDARKAVGEVCRVARRFVVVSVPSKADTNPEHIHQFDPAKIEAMFSAQGMAKVSVDAVLNHFILVARAVFPGDIR